MKYDRVTEKIQELLLQIPSVGKKFAQLYMWNPLMFNFMLVGSSGTVLSWILYEGIFRILLFGFWGGTFWGMAITGFLVFLWNFVWNKRWSLSPAAQCMKMKKKELKSLHDQIHELLRVKPDAE